jgi:type I restriction enzyme M protein
MAPITPLSGKTTNILCGNPVGRMDWKSYMLPLLFFKRMWNVWDDEHQEVIEF